MSDAEINRLRRDLDVVQNAAGLELPFGWKETWLGVAFVPAFVIIAVSGAFFYEYRNVSAIPLLLLCLAYIGVWWQRYRHNLRGQREHKLALITVVAFAAAIAGVVLLSKIFGLPDDKAKKIMLSGGFLSGGLIFAGLMFVPLALSNPVRRSFLACSVLAIPLGVAIPFCTPQQLVIISGLTGAAACLVAVGIMAWQLRTYGREHGPTAH